MTSLPDLSLVTPAHNEAGTIAQTVRAWSTELGRLGMTFEWLVFDDGSTDDTRAILETLADEVPGLRVIAQPNQGHGPTVVSGYRHARGRWIFQLDGDDEVGPAPFESFWSRRGGFDLLIGRRHDRDLVLARRALTLATRAAVRLLFGKSVTDANVPYRLMRAEAMAPLIAELPDDAFAPNVMLSGLAVARGLRIAEIDVRSRPQPTRRRANWGLASAAWRGFSQALALRRRARR